MKMKVHHTIIKRDKETFVHGDEIEVTPQEAEKWKTKLRPLEGKPTVVRKAAPEPGLSEA